MSVRSRLALRFTSPLLATAALLAAPSLAQAPSGRPVDGLPAIELAPLDLAFLADDDARREAQGAAPRFAVPHPVSISPLTSGAWENVDADTLLWRLRVASPGALSLNLAFETFELSPSASLVVHATGQTSIHHAYTAADNAAHGELWTPVVIGDDLVVELTVPLQELDLVRLELTSINVGYRYFGEKHGPAPEAGACNNDVVCPEGDPWADEIASVGVISTGGSTFCTGFMVNNTAQDETPYFMTANHCGIGGGNAASLVVYWNFQSPTCGQQGGGSLAENQTGSFFRASASSSDFTLVELDSPPNPAWNVSFAGWDRSGADTPGAVAIHHPSTDEKSISFENDPTTTTSYLGSSVPGDGTHVRVLDWDDGTTEPGSSGSPLFDLDHRVIGQLHGGFAACGNDLEDWYGRLSVSWTGGGSPSTRLSDWLDPIGTGAVTLDTLAPGATGLRVTPSSPFVAQGDVGGPFTPSSFGYVLENKGMTSFSYDVSTAAVWLSIANGSGSLAPGATTLVTVSINSLADVLPTGIHEEQVAFTNLTTGEGDTVRKVELTVGIPQIVHDVPFDVDPGWARQGGWEFGSPSGGGGQFGNPDPAGSFTGANAFGYNHAGDYPNNLSERHLTSTPFDCSNLIGTTLTFARYLNVEQPLYDHAYLRISTDGTSFSQVWENGSEITDSSWQTVSYDISDVADGQSTVYLRWTMGTTDGSWQYSGWNIDDVQISGLVDNGVQVYCTAKVSSSGCTPQIGFSGTPSASNAGPFVVEAQQVEAFKSGIFFHGTSGSSNAPFLGGTLCVNPPLVRSSVQNSGAAGQPPCTGVLNLDLNAAGISATIGVGTDTWLQGWFRDPADPSGSGLTNALAFTVKP